MQIVGVIGGSGFIGSYVTKIFLEENLQERFLRLILIIRANMSIYLI